MAITPTGDIFKGFEFDGLSSKNYGIYITGNAVYNAPERDVEMITIPGRNGTFALDQGRFENIEVTYPAGIFADNELDFAEAISDFRNYLCSRNGYCRLTDEYNPTEYRMAVYKSGLEVTPAQLKAGQFNITFECKPQRFLMSGEAAVSVASGATLLNPTLFESSPMLEVTGYGTINLGNQPITVDDGEFGEMQIGNASHSFNSDITVNLDETNLNANDEIYRLDSTNPHVELWIRGNSAFTLTVDSITNGAYSLNQTSSTVIGLIVTPTLPRFYKGQSQTITTTVSLKINNQSYTYTVTTAYSASASTIAFSATRSGSWPSSGFGYSTYYYTPVFYGYSTKTLRPTPLYIDLDLGEAYGDINGEILSFNNLVSMPARLPVLKTGANAISYDLTVTELKIAPRWWKI